MKKINFTQAGGFPLEEKTLDNMQTAYFDVLKTIIGHFGLAYVGNFIIYGCEVVANTIQPGMMYIEGDLCFFAGSNGNLTTKIKKIETIEDAPFESGNNLPTYFDYLALVNSGGVVLSDFVRLPKVSELVNPDNLVIDANYIHTANDFTDDLKTKLEGIEENSQKNIKSDWEAQIGSDNEILNKPTGNLLTFLLKGTYPIGDPTGADDQKTVTFTNIGTTNYMVIGSIVSKANSYFDDDINYVIKNKTATSFTLILNDTGTPSQTQNLEFDYCIIPF